MGIRGDCKTNIRGVMEESLELNAGGDRPTKVKSAGRDAGGTLILLRPESAGVFFQNAEVHYYE